MIFITENDVLQEGKALYHIERMIDGERPFADGAHIIYVNGAFRGDTLIGQLMHDFNCTDADDMKDPLLQSRARYFKETTEGVSSMCRMMEEMRNEVAEKTAVEQAIKDAIDHVKKLVEKLKISAEDAADMLEIPEGYRAIVLEALNAQ